MERELSPSEAAARLGTTTRSVQRWIARGVLPARRVGGRWRIAVETLDAFVADVSAVAGPDVEAAGATLAAAPRPIRHVFVANRGEIARRIAATARRVGVAVTVPGVGTAPAVDLLDAAAVVAAAGSAGADALHPGYGFLSENAAFARAVEESGLTWVGPPPAAIAAMGDKAAARQLAASLGIPVAPGYDGDDQSDERLRVEAARIGFPILVKPAGGGGGKGMRTVRDPDQLLDALASARREARAAFGDDRLVLERLVEGARHVEIQVLFDGHGRGVSLGERDCSLQRRRQKVLEETPSPGVGEDLRSALSEAALRLAAAVGYVGAGTCEFLVDERGAFSFLEMNTRLQVEHPVTEAVTGRDLVRDQLAVAAGRSLAELGFDGRAEASVRTSGHAIEVRVYAEDAEAGFLPSTGRIVALEWPRGASTFEWSAAVRVDSGVDLGAVVDSRFDPMLAKLAVRGATREEALDRLAAALDETVILGVVTNLRFLRWLVREPAVRSGLARIDTLERIWPPDDWSDRTAVPDETWRTAATALAPDDGPWGGAWRLNGPSRIRVRAEGVDRTVTFDPRADSAGGGPRAAALSELPSRPALVVATGDGERTVEVDVGGRSVRFTLAPPPDADRSLATAAGASNGGTATVDAPMPGNVLAIHVSAGERVEAGAPIVTLEAMKMEHVVLAPGAGIVAEIRVAPRDQVVRGQLIAIVAGESDAPADRG